MKKKLAVLLMAGLLGVTLAACGGSKEQKKELETTGNESKSEEKIPLKISHHPYLHALPSIYAEDNGLYDEFDYTIGATR